MYYVINGLCNVILHVCRNSWKTLQIDSPNAFMNDISPKFIKHYYFKVDWFLKHSDFM